MTKLLFLDTETTGLDPKRHDVIQIAGVIEDTCRTFEPVQFEINMQPFDYESISKEALAANNTTIEQLQTYQTPKEGIKQLIGIFDKFIDRYNKEDKFVVVGYRTQFDVDFLRETFAKAGEKYFGSYISGYSIDVYELLKFFNVTFNWGMKKQTLGSYVDLKK